MWIISLRFVTFLHHAVSMAFFFHFSMADVPTWTLKWADCRDADKYWLTYFVPTKHYFIFIVRLSIDFHDVWNTIAAKHYDDAAATVKMTLTYFSSHVGSFDKHRGADYWWHGSFSMTMQNIFIFIDGVNIEEDDDFQSRTRFFRKHRDYDASRCRVSSFQTWLLP